MKKPVVRVSGRWKMLDRQLICSATSKVKQAETQDPRKGTRRFILMSSIKTFYSSEKYL